MSGGETITIPTEHHEMRRIGYMKGPGWEKFRLVCPSCGRVVEVDADRDPRERPLVCVHVLYEPSDEVEAPGGHDATDARERHSAIRAVLLSYLYLTMAIAALLVLTFFVTRPLSW